MTDRSFYGKKPPTTPEKKLARNLRRAIESDPRTQSEIAYCLSDLGLNFNQQKISRVLNTGSLTAVDMAGLCCVLGVAPGVLLADVFSPGSIDSIRETVDGITQSALDSQ